jgi:hypothetical protein
MAKQALLCPPAISIHNDGNMPGQNIYFSSKADIKNPRKQGHEGTVNFGIPPFKGKDLKSKYEVRVQYEEWP